MKEFENRGGYEAPKLESLRISSAIGVQFTASVSELADSDVYEVM